MVAPPTTDTARVALVHDFLLDLRGAERVFLELCELFPQADLFTAVHDAVGTEGRFDHREVRTTYLQRLRPTTSASMPLDEPALVVHDRGRLLRVPLAEVLYLKAELKYVTLRTALHTHVLDESLAELEARVGPGFLRVHRNALVALRAVRALERRALAGDDADEAGETWAVQVAPVGEWLAVSRRQVSAVREALAKGR